MRVGVLGPLVVQIEDGPFSVPGRRQRDLLVALLVRRGTPVSPEALLELVWRNENGSGAMTSPRRASTTAAPSPTGAARSRSPG